MGDSSRIRVDENQQEAMSNVVQTSDPQYLVSLLTQLSEMANSNDTEAQLDTLRMVRRMLSTPPLYIDGMIASGIVPILVNCLKSTDVNIQFEAAWSLTNIAAGTPEQIKVVVDAGAVPLLIQMVSSDSLHVRAQAVWAIANIIGGGAEYREYCLQFGFLEPLLATVNSETSLLLLKNVAFLLLNICRPTASPVAPKIVKKILPVLAVLIHHTDTSILVDTLWTLSFLTEGEYIQMVINRKIVPVLIPLLGNSDAKIQEAALRTVGSIATGLDEHAQHLLDCGVLKVMPVFLTHENETIKKEAVWFLSNVVTNNPEQIQAIIDAGLVPMVITLLQIGDFPIQKEAAFFLSNIAECGSREQVAYTVNLGVIAPFCGLLGCEDVNIIQVVLDGINRILKMAGDEVDAICTQIKECGGLDKIKNLQNCENEDVIKVTHEIMNTYFSSEFHNMHIK